MDQKIVLPLLVCLMPLLADATPKVNVSICYEALCPDSVDFIINQFYPTYMKLEDYINVEFIPYGKASQTRSRQGHWSFRCQHGSAECKGNKYQACAINLEKNQTKNVRFVNCVMSLSYPASSSGIEDCADSNNYDWVKIAHCVQGEEGGNLLANLGIRTEQLMPRLRFVPSVLYNTKFDNDLQDQSMSDFQGVVCDQIENPKPAACES